MAKASRLPFGPFWGPLRTPLTIGIRREDPTRIWERRAPLTPDAVDYLVSKKNVRVHVEHCDRRVYHDHEYIEAGASVERNLEEAHIILGIKENPLSELINSPVQTPITSQLKVPWSARTHLMFSHTAKGQPYNTPLLSRFVANRNQTSFVNTLLPRLIDYELLADDATGKRTVGFGWFAGVAGVLESLSAMAHSHLEIGIASPFLYTPRPHTVPSLEGLRKILRDIGNRIANDGTPAKLGPFVIGLTGRGKVAEGCLSMLSELPIVNVSVKDLDALVKDEKSDLRKIYLAHAKPEDYLSSLDGRKYDRDHYYKYPQSYRSHFCDKVAPYLTLFLNGTGWSPSFPRLLTNDQLTVALDRAQAIGGARFTNIGDISCDVEGGLQFLTRSTTLSSPFYKTRPSSLPDYLPAVQIMAVDILPTSIPLDSSKHFSQALLPYVESLIETYTSGAVDSYTSGLDRATIAVDGQLVGKHVWLQDTIDNWRESNENGVPNVTRESSEYLTNEGEIVIGRSGNLRKKRILMLGSGMVARPAVGEIAKRGDVQLVIASNSLTEVENLTKDYPNVQHRIIDMNDSNTVSHLVEEADVVISLLPVTLHPAAAEWCVRHRKHLVTASYISDAMKALHDRAIAADVILLNEIGLDPGIDHCSAISLISKLQAQHKRILSFTSFCGGLPAPDVPTVPLRYKFSWSPRGVLSAVLNPARYRLNNKEWNISSADLLRSYFPNVPITEEFDLEGIANRDSLPYADTYNLGPAQRMRTLLRGTLRYPGFSNLMQSFKSLGLLETTKTIHLERWSSLVQQCLSLQPGHQLDLPSAIKSHVHNSQAEQLHEALEWLSLIPPTSVGCSPTPMPLLPAEPMSPIDIFAYLLAFKLRYLPNERDMVILSHEVVAKGPAPGAPEEAYTSSLITYGTPTASAMARTVGLPVALAALNVLDGKVAVRGVTGPSDPSVYGPVLNRLEEVGLGMTESLRFNGTIENCLMNGLR